MKADPIGFRGGINLYSYVRSNPITLFDMLALMDFSGPTLESMQEQMRRQAARDYQYIDYINKQKHLEMAFPESGYTGWEVHLFGGIGGLSTFCCDGDKKMRHNYIKVCMGSAIDASVAIGEEYDWFKHNKGTCSNPPKKMFGPEVGVTVFGIGSVEGAYTFDQENISSVGSAGYGVGVPIPYSHKVTTCKYVWIGSEQVGCCRNQ